MPRSRLIFLVRGNLVINAEDGFGNRKPFIFRNTVAAKAKSETVPLGTISILPDLSLNLSQ